MLRALPKPLSPGTVERIRIEIPINETSGIQDSNEITAYLTATAKVTFVALPARLYSKARIWTWSKLFTTALPAEYSVRFELNDKAASAFAEATAAHVGQNIKVSS